MTRQICPVQMMGEVPVGTLKKHVERVVRRTRELAPCDEMLASMASRHMHARLCIAFDAYTSN